MRPCRTDWPGLDEFRSTTFSIDDWRRDPERAAEIHKEA